MARQITPQSPSERSSTAPGSPDRIKTGPITFLVGMAERDRVSVPKEPVLPAEGGMPNWTGGLEKALSLTGDRGFESSSLQRGVWCEPRSRRSAQAASVAIDLSEDEAISLMRSRSISA
jgi:hypothetical protein